MFIYLIIHLTKHYEAKGIGIRFFIDIYLYNRHYKHVMDWDYIRRELSEPGLWRFAENMMGLYSVWFEGAENNEVIDEMAEYVISSGVYGTGRNSVLSEISAERYTNLPPWYAKNMVRMKQLFPPIHVMKVRYPYLLKTPLLLPFCWILRGIRVLLFKRKYAFYIIKTIGSVNGEDIDRIKKLHSKTGLIRPHKKSK